MIAGFPEKGMDMDVARGLIDGGCSFLEVQFPFSDPSADGVPIQTACVKALEGGFRIDDGFTLVRDIHGISDVPIFIMGYGSIVFARGVETFVRTAVASGAAGMIIPDLMPGYDEGLFDAGKKAGIAVVPVVPPGITESRLAEILAHDPPYLYASLRVGITGSRTELEDHVYTFLGTLRATGRQILAGFGIQTGEQVRQLKDCADALIVGSAIVRTIDAALREGRPVYDAAREKVRELMEGDGRGETEKTH
jgi:tryptophan synthase alpha chain